MTWWDVLVGGALREAKGVLNGDGGTFELVGEGMAQLDVTDAPRLSGDLVGDPLVARATRARGKLRLHVPAHRLLPFRTNLGEKSVKVWGVPLLSERNRTVMAWSGSWMSGCSAWSFGSFQRVISPRKMSATIDPVKRRVKFESTSGRLYAS